MSLAAALLTPLAVLAQSPLLDSACVEPFATSSGYVLTPVCPPQPLAVLVDDTGNPLDLLPPIGEPRRRESLRIYQARIPGTEIYVTPSPLRNQWMYRPGEAYTPSQQLPSGPREAASDFVFGVRVPF